MIDDIIIFVPIIIIENLWIQKNLNLKAFESKVRELLLDMCLWTGHLPSYLFSSHSSYPVVWSIRDFASWGECYGYALVFDEELIIQ